jgi:hypothetical protein
MFCRPLELCHTGLKRASPGSLLDQGMFDGKKMKASGIDVDRIFQAPTAGSDAISVRNYTGLPIDDLAEEDPVETGAHAGLSSVCCACLCRL